MTEPLDLIEARLTGAGCQPKRRGDTIKALCPAHNDHNTSLDVTRGTTRDVVLICRSRNCDADDVLRALDLTWKDFGTNGTEVPTPPAEYIYRDQHSRPYNRVTRGEGKQFRQQHWNGSQWVPGLADHKPILYRLDELIRAVDAGQTVWITEGEKDADALVRAGVPATTAPMGAGKWSKVAPVAEKWLKGADVVICGDWDDVGRDHTQEVAAHLDGIAETVQIRRAAHGKDASDHLHTFGLGIGDLVDVTPDELTAENTGEADNETDDPEGAELAAGYEPADIAAILAGEGTPTPKPELIEPCNNDSPGLFYPGSLNGLHGDSGTGKSWAALKAAAQMMANGGSVLWVNLEGSAEDTVGRLLALGADPDTLSAHFVHITPENTIQGQRQHLAEMVTDRNITMLVLDSLGEAFAIDGVNEDRDDEVGPWLRKVLRPLADAGVMVLVIDHSTKAKENALFPSGSKRKRAAVTGAAYLVEAKPAFSKDAEGWLQLKVAKDRHGARARNTVAVKIKVTPHGATLTMETFAPTSDKGDAGDADNAIDFAAKVITAIGKHLSYDRSRTVSRSEIETMALKSVKGSNADKRGAMDWAVSNGYLTEIEGPRKARLTGWVRDVQDDETDDTEKQ